MDIVQNQSNALAVMPWIPLLGALLSYLLGTRVKTQLAGWVATAASASSFFIALLLFKNLHESQGPIEAVLFSWAQIGSLSFDFSFRFDELSAVMCLVVTGVGTLIHLYSIGYMSHDDSQPRFFAYLNLFLFSMLLLVLGGNLLVLFFGWEGVGLCSYLLIGFWHKNKEFVRAGRKAFIANRIGDAGLLIGIFLCFLHFGTLDFSLLQAGIQGKESWVYDCIALCLFIGAAGKSAQIPLYVWLPDAMAGPTPVSALIHAATMVTAGVYLLTRLHFLYALAPLASAIILVIAILTALVAALIAICQNDLKKILAYSTVSQLGFMFIAAASGAYAIAIFHVVTHAFFKACLFLSAGSIIHACDGEQDIQRMGGLWKKLPWTFASFLAATIALVGIFPFAGYQSKHAILASLQGLSNPHMTASCVSALYWISSGVALLTALYMARCVGKTFFGKYRGDAHVHESPLVMLLPIVVLAVLSVSGGLLLEKQYGILEYLAAFAGRANVSHATHGEGGFLDGILSSLPALGLFLLVGYLSIFQSGKVKNFYNSLGIFGKFLEKKMYVDEIYSFLIIGPLKFLRSVLALGIERVALDGFVEGVGVSTQLTGESFRGLQSGQLRQYALLIFLSIALCVASVLHFSSSQVADLKLRALQAEQTLPGGEIH